jgi:hypothetical protein
MRVNASLSSFAGEGYSNWKRAQEKIAMHETSKSHLESVIALTLRSKQHANIDRILQQEVSL